MSSQRSGLEIIQEFIRTEYDLGEVGLPRHLERAHQRRHQKLVVDTGAGRFLIKTYRRKPEVLDALRFQHRLSDHMHHNGLPVARIQAARSGKRIAEAETWAMELQAFVEGDSMPVNEETLAIAGDALGRFHVVCADVPCPDRDARMWRFSEAPRETFAELYRKARSQRDPGRCDDCCNRIALFLRDAAHALSFEARNQLETGLIHGDWHSGNLIFKGNKLAAIVDLEFAGDGCYLEDLAYAVSNLCIRTSTGPDRLAWRTDALLAAYQRHRSMAYTEELALYYAVGIKQVATVAYQLRHKERVAGLDSAEWLFRLADQCGWLIAQAQRLRWR